MGKHTSDADNEEQGSRLMKVVEAIAIEPEDARQLVSGYRRKVRAAHPGMSEGKRQKLLAEAIVARYAKLAAISGGTTGLSAIIPGVGTAVAVLGGALGDTAVTLKLQVDMCMCLADVFEHDLTNEDTRHLAFLISLGGSLEKAGAGVGVQIASKAGVKLVRQYLKGATLQLIKELFKKVGLVFTRKAMEKSIPFGVGVVVGAGGNYALVRYVGRQAIEWFVIDKGE